MEQNELNEQTDISRFLEKFNQDFLVLDSVQSAHPSHETSLPDGMEFEQYSKSFEKLEDKIKELEDKFAASTAQNEAVMKEIARTRQAVENQKSKDAFFENIAATISNLKQSVENLSRARHYSPEYEAAPTINRAFDVPASSVKEPASSLPVREYGADSSALQDVLAEKSKVQADLYTERAEKEKLLTAWHQERATSLRELEGAKNDSAEKARIISSLQQKASQLKAVNIALDREIKRSQQERTEALRKSAEQAKEILSLRDALTAAEERFKSFNFEGRIISIKRQYEQKVSKLETQLHEISNTCMKQVEEIESLKAENLKLHKLAEEREQLAALYEAKTHELEALQASVERMRMDTENYNESRLAAFTQRMQNLQTEHEDLAARLTQAQETIQSVSAEKQTLEKNFKALLTKIEKNDAVIEQLKQKIAVLTQENEELKHTQTAAPHKPTASKSTPDPVAVRTPVVKNRIHKKQEPVPPAAPALPVAPATPVETQSTLRAPVQTEADLPEIRVAAPIPQEELYNGEDFLEKTDSFIGRMKWSLFREDK